MSVSPHAEHSERCSHGSIVTGVYLGRGRVNPHCHNRARRGSLYCEPHYDEAVERVLRLPRATAIGQATVTGHADVNRTLLRFVWLDDGRRLDVEFVTARELRAFVRARRIWDEPSKTADAALITSSVA